jgi:hypothetical protein
VSRCIEYVLSAVRQGIFRRHCERRVLKLSTRFDDYLSNAELAIRRERAETQRAINERIERDALLNDLRERAWLHLREEMKRLTWNRTLAGNQFLWQDHRLHLGRCGLTFVEKPEYVADEKRRGIGIVEGRAIIIDTPPGTSNFGGKLILEPVLVKNEVRWNVPALRTRNATSDELAPELLKELIRRYQHDMVWHQGSASER